MTGIVRQAEKHGKRRIHGLLPGVRPAFFPDGSKLASGKAPR